MTMNSFTSTLYRDLTCAAAAALITVVIGLSFVASTSVAPGHNAARAAVAVQASGQAQRA
jgi:short-subunit dehydrogenase involved in D-alanine esterification of teichoic acids